MDTDALLLAMLDSEAVLSEGDPGWDGYFLLLRGARGAKYLVADGGVRVSALLVDELEDEGLVRTRSSTSSSVERAFGFTRAGRERARAARDRQRTTAVPAEAVSLGWPVVESRLAKFVRDFEAAGSPEYGVPTPSDVPEAQFRALVGPYVEDTGLGTDQQALYRPTQAALQELRGWPSDRRVQQAMFDRLVDELGRRPEPEARTLRDQLLATGRELFVEVVGSIAAKQSGLG